jgi:hypothetical protein
VGVAGLDLSGLRILDGALPLAYCVPGRSPRVVLSGGALDVLDDRQVCAVIAHEQAHLRHRHEWVMESFTAFHRAVPAPLRSRAPLDAVRLLLEMVADDAAARRTGPAAVREALARLSDDDGGDGRRRRLDRLAGPPQRSTMLTVLVALSAVALLVLPTVVLVRPLAGPRRQQLATVSHCACPGFSTGLIGSTLLSGSPVPRRPQWPTWRATA